jgi:hypothetical protein
VRRQIISGKNGDRRQERKPYAIVRLPYARFDEEQEGQMSSDTIEKLITNAIHTAFIKYPEGDGGPNLDYEWIAPDQSAHIAKAILLDLAANGYAIVKQSP